MVLLVATVSYHSAIGRAFGAKKAGGGRGGRWRGGALVFGCYCGVRIGSGAVCWWEATAVLLGESS